MKSRRRDRLIREPEHDPYKSRRKLPEPTACPECGAVFREGRWQWVEVPTESRTGTRRGTSRYGESS
jgi:hypothetical protein